MSRDQVRSVDRWAIEQIGLPGIALMENAGRSCAEFILDRLGRKAICRICVFCGRGNNGGDGYVIARHLRNAGHAVCVVLCGDREKVRGDARINLDVLGALGEDVRRLDPGSVDAPALVAAMAQGADIVVDALFGTGLQGPLREDYRVLVEAINALDVPILAVDIPSGLDCDTGRPLGAAVRADWTVTFVAIKQGFVASAEAAQYTGQVHVASIGIEPRTAT
ncbi:MAG: NAD(P)H-hydrate epimerase [Sedimentisphaerales bacterium]|mgnify:CR=1 FL=1|nr:NAD(P)H-hydrate epimerase [Sedimentisphaerales bacterium]